MLRFLIPIALAAAFLLQTTWMRRTTSVTFDETFYLNCALQTIHDGWLDKRLSDSGVGALPVSIWGLPVAAAYPKMNRPDEWQGSLADPPINAWFRWWNSVLIGLPLVFLVYFWLDRRRGLAAASLGGALMVFSPSILAHGSLATTDAAFALFAMLAVGSLVFYLRRPNWLRFLTLGIAVGLAIAAKYSSVFLFPVVGVLLIAKLWPTTPGGRWKRSVKVVMSATGRVVLLGCVAVTVLWGTDWFSFTGPLKYVSLEETPPDSPWVKMLGNGPTARWFMDVAHTKLFRPSVFGSLVSRYLHERDGHDAYLMGEYSRRGWRSYFLLAFVFKSTLSELTLAAIAMGLAIKILFDRQRKRFDELRASQTVWFTAGGVFGAMLCAAHVNIGHRYMLFVYPLLFLLGVDLLWQAFERRRAWLFGLSGVLLLGQTASALLVGPHYLAYFSPLIGGPEQGRYYLTDSNIDWGQDLPRLQAEFDRLGFQRPLLDYFGTAKPEAYGIKADSFRESDIDDLDRYDVIAVSVTRWTGVYWQPDDPFQAFRHRKPVGAAGYSILLYDLREPGALNDLRQARRRIPPPMDLANAVSHEKRSEP